MKVLLLSTYEMGHQPLALAAAAAALRTRDYQVQCLDVSLDDAESQLSNLGQLQGIDLVGISIPMHTAARMGIRLAQHIRRTNPSTHICFFGLYASVLHDLLISRGIADSVAGGEYELGLCNLADEISRGNNNTLQSTPGVGATPLLERWQYPLPDRNGLPGLERYARALTTDGARIAGYVEASRGCAHQCRHCPITPVYGGRLRLVQPETVLADIDILASMGAEHITFGDPDFLNAVPHSLGIIDEMNRRHPAMSFDVTVKVEHLLEHDQVLPRLRDTGCLFITSAFESCDDNVLRYLDKGHTSEDINRVLILAEQEHLVIRPTWIAFTPWATADTYLEFLRFIEEHGLVGHVQPVQYGIKLLLPPQSPLEPILREQGLLGVFDDEALTYSWISDDSRIDPLQAEVAAIIESHVPGAEPSSDWTNTALDTFSAVKRASLTSLELPTETLTLTPQPQLQVPRMTEDWFC